MEDQKTKTDHDRIELRSEKVRELLGEEPAGPLRWGIAVICLIFAVIIAAVMCMTGRTAMASRYSSIFSDDIFIIKTPFFQKSVKRILSGRYYFVDL